MDSQQGIGTRVQAELPRRVSAMAERLRLVIAEDNYLVREGTRGPLEDSGEVDVVAAVDNAEELRDAMRRLAPDRANA
jgi:hypothetical protein